MVTTLRKLVYFGALLVALSGVFLLLLKSEIGYIPEALQYGLLSFIFILGLMLAVLISKRGLGG